MERDEFKITFWGCRGTTAFSSPTMCEYGSNTSCVSVECGNNLLIFDAGTGIIGMKNEYLMKNQYRKANLFFSHYHYDHIEGLPFSDIYNNKGIDLHFYGRSVHHETCLEILKKAFCPPYYPISFYPDESSMFHILDEANSIKIDKDINIEYVLVNHPGGSTAFKVTYKGIVFCYLCDYEYDGDPLGTVRSFIRNVDCLVYDAHFSLDNYIKGWGHSTWESAIKLSEEEKVKMTILSHHNPAFDDKKLTQIAEKVSASSHKVILAKEGMFLDLI